MAEVDRALADIAASNHSLITLSHVLAAGGTRASAHRRVASGRWERVGRGVFRIAGTPWTHEARVLAAVLESGPGAVASHLCAARLWGLGFSTAAPEVTIPRGRRHRPGGFRTHESTDLDRCEVRVVSCIPVTDPDRTILDLGRYLREPSLMRAAEAARRRDLVTWNSLLHTLLAHARQGRHGITRLREVVSKGLLTDGVTDTDSELIALSLVRESSVPDPVLHHEIRAPDGELLAEIDLAWLGDKVAVEIDGEVHNDPVVRMKDDARDALLRSLGWKVRRVWKNIPLEQPTQFLQIVRSALKDPSSDR